ncbi:PDC sensor domain-containing protein [Pseudomonas sp. PhalM4]
MSAIQSFADVYGTPPQASRYAANEAAKATFLRDRTLLGVWTALEPNQLGEDKNFVNATVSGSNDHGRFAAYWNRNTGSVANEPTAEQMFHDTSIGESGLPFNYFYECSQKSGKPCLAPPFTATLAGRQVLITTLSTPISYKGATTGVVGLDITIADLQDLMLEAKRNLYDGAGDVAIITSSGIVAAFTSSAASLGQNSATAGLPSIADLTKMLQMKMPCTSTMARSSKSSTQFALARASHRGGLYFSYPKR